MAASFKKVFLSFIGWFIGGIVGLAFVAAALFAIVAGIMCLFNGGDYAAAATALWIALTSGPKK